MLFPTGRVSPIQEAQMTSVLDDNVHCISVEGTFDDCQVRRPPPALARLARTCGRAPAGSTLGLTPRRTLSARSLVAARPSGHRQGALLGPGLQQDAPARRRQLDQLGAHPCPDHVLLPLVPRAAGGHDAIVRRPDRQLWRHPRWLLRQAARPADGQARRRDQRERHPRPLLADGRLREVGAGPEGRGQGDALAGDGHHGLVQL